jgi:hypothetical protein
MDMTRAARISWRVTFPETTSHRAPVARNALPPSEVVRPDPVVIGIVVRRGGENPIWARST